MRWVSDLKSLTSDWFWSEFNGWDYWKRKFCTKMWELLWHGKKVWHLNLDHYEQVSGSLDGKLIVWDSWTGNKIQVDSKFVVMCFRNGGLHASWHRWSPWSLRGWWPLPSRQAATWSRAGAWTTCSPCTTSTAGLASESSHPVNWIQYKKQHNIFLSQKNRVTSILQFLSAGMPAEWRSLSERSLGKYFVSNLASLQFILPRGLAYWSFFQKWCGRLMTKDSFSDMKVFFPLRDSLTMTTSSQVQNFF